MHVAGHQSAPTISTYGDAWLVLIRILMTTGTEIRPHRVKGNSWFLHFHQANELQRRFATVHLVLYGFLEQQCNVHNDKKQQVIWFFWRFIQSSQDTPKSRLMPKYTGHWARACRKQRLGGLMERLARGQSAGPVWSAQQLHRFLGPEPAGGSWQWFLGPGSLPRPAQVP